MLGCSLRPPGPMGGLNPSLLPFLPAFCLLEPAVNCKAKVILGVVFGRATSHCRDRGNLVVGPGAELMYFHETWWSELQGDAKDVLFTSCTCFEQWKGTGLHQVQGCSSNWPGGLGVPVPITTWHGGCTRDATGGKGWSWGKLLALEL